MRAASPSSERPRALVADDEPPIVRALDRMLRRDFDIETATTGTEALERLTAERFDLVLCDLMMPHLDGVGVYEAARQRGRAPKAWIMMTGGIPPSSLEQLAADGVVVPLSKPFTIAAVEAAVAAARAKEGS